jgi:hypothetical protein
MEAIEDLGEAGFQEDQMDVMFRTGVPIVNKVDAESEDHARTDDGGLLQNIRETAHELLKPILDRTAAITTPTPTAPSEEQAVDTMPMPIPAATTTSEEQDVDTTTVKISPRKRAVDTSQYAENNNNIDDTDNTEKVQAVTIDKPANISNGHHTKIAHPIETPVKEEVITPANNSSTSEISTPMASEKIARQEQVTRACVGAIAGAVLGVALALIIRVINPVLVSGLVVIVFYTMLGAIVGAAFGAFLRMRPLEGRVFYYQGDKPRRTIVAVKTEEHQEEALNILYRHGASYASIHERSFE